ncbi:MAG: extracellular solute-binding protein [Verrucomicrobia bacterium]|jgi:ABC-type glycerol-3-phosphate transport system substrate-binding protein|nr:extracellular solute-binding protein [Verrucomicrobiota bacterium]
MRPEPLIPIAVRGFDRKTMMTLWKYYFSQLNQELVDEYSRSGKGLMNIPEEMALLLAGDLKDLEPSIWAPAEILIEIGQYFADGFSAIDLETAKALYAQGRVAFMIEGSYNGLSLIQNSPFEVEAIPLPSVDPTGTPWSQYQDGEISEGGQVAIWYGVTRKSKEKELAIDFLRFWMSYEMNQLHAGSCAWPPIVRDAEFKGLMTKFKPRTDGLPEIADLLDYYKSPGMDMLGLLESMIIEVKQKREKGKDVSDLNAKTFAEGVKAIMLEKELKSMEILLDNAQRFALNGEAVRAGAMLLMMRSDISEEEKARQHRRRMIQLEGTVDFENTRNLMDYVRVAKELRQSHGD